MPLPKAQLKGFTDELSKIGDKPIAKMLNKLLFQASDEEVAMEHPELQPPQPQPPAAGQADLGQGQSSNAVGNSKMVTPSAGPGGV